MFLLRSSSLLRCELRSLRPLDNFRSKIPQVADVSVIVLNYNGRKWLADCLDALVTQQNAPTFEVVFVDNASSDGSAEFVAERYPSVRVVRNARNLGFAAGNNSGARVARGAWLAFLNNDTVAAREWVAKLWQAATDPGHQENVALVTSRIESLARPGVLDSAGDGYLRAGGAFKRGHGAQASTFPQSEEVFGACGAAFMIRRDVFDALGGFDERFFMVYEDVDLSYRARLAGFRCWYEADAVVRHAGSGTLGVASHRAVYYGQRNLELTWLKNTPLLLLLRTLPSHVMYSTAGLLHYVLRGRGLAAFGGKAAAVLAVPGLLLRRRAVQRTRRVDLRSLVSAMDGGWLALKRREKSTRLDLSN
jgi:N-acetylglucosaminyl-diphospho-decaprenol L-rhamnosyltransferase